MINPSRMDTLYDEIYRESREETSFFGFFSGSQVQKKVGCLRMDAAMQPFLQLLAREEIHVAEGCFPL